MDEKTNLEETKLYMEFISGKCDNRSYWTSLLGGILEKVKTRDINIKLKQLYLDAGKYNIQLVMI